MSANISAILQLFPKHGSSATVTPISNSLSTKQQYDTLIDPLLLEKLSESMQKHAPTLWHGQWQKIEGNPFNLGYASQSEADLALARYISNACVREQT